MRESEGNEGMEREGKEMEEWGMRGNEGMGNEGK